MRKKLKIVTLDGIDGIGKTSQAIVLSNYFKNLGIPCKINTLKEDDVSFISEHIDNIKLFIKENPEGIIINDGSIAKMMIVDLCNGIKRDDVLEKYKNALYEYQVLNHLYGICNILILLDDVSICDERIKKRDSLLGVESRGILDYQKEVVLMEGMKTFDNHIASKNLIFHIVNTIPEDSILDINKEVIEIINQNFEIKKPSKEG